MRKARLRPIGFMLGYVRRYWFRHGVVLAAVVAAVACATGSQYAIRDLVDALTGGNRAQVWLSVAVLAGLITFDNLLWRAAGWVASFVFVDVTGDVRRDLFRHLVGHAPAFFIARLPGALAGRVSAAAASFHSIETIFTWRALPPCLGVVGAILVLATVDPLMAVALLGVAVAMALGLTRMSVRGRPLHQEYAAEASAVDGELVDVVNNILLVRAFGATDREYRRFSGKVGAEVRARSKSLAFLENLRLLHAAATAVITAALLGWAVLLWQRGLATPGDVVLVVTLGFTILHGTRDLAVASVDLVQFMARLGEAVETLLAPHDMPEEGRVGLAKVSRGRISFRGVGFAYPNRPAVLEDFNLDVASGERLGLVGRSGAGKSTVVALMQRLWEPGRGTILIDGEPLAGLSRESLATSVSVVPQDVMLFHRSVLENVRYGRPDASEAEVRAALEAAGCNEFLNALPQGLATTVGERGVQLSGGQRQRLAIARAFLRDAPILLLDEATSSLDSESEQIVQWALERLMQGRTVVAIAHRLSTLSEFDRIVVLDGGRIVQEGPPEMLARTAGPYQQLLRRQGLHLVRPEAA
ncbi:MAG: ABC transporter ATP-binding protein [Acetobacteraceae bacterium]